jgi:hypothetical protein
MVSSIFEGIALKIELICKFLLWCEAWGALWVWISVDTQSKVILYDFICQMFGEII